MTVRTLSEVRLGETTLSLDPRGTGKFLVRIIDEGEGSSAIYTREALQRAVGRHFAAGKALARAVALAAAGLAGIGVGNHALFALQPAQVAADTRTQVLVELPGHGASSEIRAAPDAATMQAALQAVCTQLLAGQALEIHAHQGACSYLPALLDALPAPASAVVLHQPWLLTV